MNCKSNTKLIAAFAVLAMMFAGFGAIVIAQGDDAVPVNDKDIVVTYNGVIAFAEGESAADFLPGEMTISSELDVAALDDLNVIEYDQYNTYIKPYLKSIGEDTFAVFPADEFDLTDPTFKNILDKTTAYVKATGEGLVTMIVFDLDLKNEVLIAAASSDAAKIDAIGIAAACNLVPEGYVSEAEAAAAVIAAVAAAVAQFDGYLSPEEVDELVDEVIASFDGYLSPEEVKAAVDKAIAETKEVYKYTQADLDKAVEDAKASVEPIVKKDNTFLYVSIVLGALVVVLAVLFAYFFYLKPKLANKAKKGPVKI